MIRIKKKQLEIFLKKYSLVALLLIGIFKINAQSLDKVAREKIRNLEKLISKAERNDIDVLKEKTTIRTAETFLTYANWDEKHIAENEKYFKKVPLYRDDALEKAKALPDFERKEVVLMLDEAISYLQLLIDKQVFRKPSKNIDWERVGVEGDQLTFEGRPVFLTDYTWKPDTKKLTEFHGNQDGFFITPSYIQQDGSLIPSVYNKLSSKEDGTLGFIFLNHKTVPEWALKAYGDSLVLPTDRYTVYDIDNPGAKDFQRRLIKAVVPFTANRKFSELGYMLCNEPHFFTQKTGDKLAWASGPVTEFTKAKFRNWLKQKHQNIDVLNKLWSSNFKNFETIRINIPIDTGLQGTPTWYDWNLFNLHRVTEWYQFLKNEIKKYDTNAKVHLKIMPNLWTDNKRSHGIDLEALTEMSGIVGNDSGAEHNRTWGPPYEWEKDYAFEWRELCMGFDFMKSVSPKKINFNSELHYLSTVRSRNLYLDPQYARAVFWLAHTYGMTASQIWYWPRKENGAISGRAGKGYAGSNSQQPRVTNEVATTMIDLNTNAEVIMAMQRQRKPVRIFYSKTSAINKKEHMDDLFHLYESLNFEGIPLGFVTKNIFEKQDHKKWDVVLVRKTPYATEEEFNAIQNYLDQGGTVIIDSESLKRNEYGVPMTKTLKQETGNLIELSSKESIKKVLMLFLERKGLGGNIIIEETNKVGKKGCIWKVVKNKKGNDVLSVVNVGKTNASLKISFKNKKQFVCIDLIKGVEVNTNPILKPYEVYFVELINMK
ncbi:beta-galactosidase [Flavivirga algicola]|uniref:Glycoside hydrolase family 42 N-terminal domain-containing protein n=1 Tax=Flavivirga algicola TaxID=2729136 RepID=A0ABX1RX73_9FLAO|nr:beta-galactosidase [Flavivirga algicola]NMH86809.1 hypothetical protein [Flavivirga algicola]